ncbi:RNA polymerase sigma-70 factor [Parabacteroides faecis]|uniref:RNA polymerase sigma-70 factor (ECF subfamily) n=1 Tax=Parabacteroides faecis TaxID=1217282 RepID=A0ABR6KND7_9BACT|nr:RNA polymerase sigma-70 factor [Parabacteroides faecis]MBB4623012.1 RNA polymerase sigma-70 factor (ECF subfamily) [Parabacteroides faecis]GGJ93168.1 DNA-directed RNA polymerase sigma-70 factor [Parabacteroides faecis]
MGKLDKQQEYFVMSALRQDSKEAFSLLFQTYYTDLVLFCGNFVKDKDSCEDIVQSIFLKLWNDRKNIQIEISLKSYLLKAVRNSCLDEFRHIEIVRQYETEYGSSVLDNYDTENYILYSDLYAHLSRALEKIPDLYKEAFVLNRFEGLKYREIAEKLNVSERTVEVRVSKTLDLLRKQLKDFFVFLISIGIP